MVCDMSFSTLTCRGRENKIDVETRRLKENSQALKSGAVLSKMKRKLPTFDFIWGWVFSLCFVLFCCYRGSFCIKLIINGGFAIDSNIMTSLHN